MKRLILAAAICALFHPAAIAQEQFNIMNPAVQEFVSKSNSTFSSASGNFDNAFFDGVRDYRPDQPVSKTIRVVRRGTGSDAGIIAGRQARKLILEVHFPDAPWLDYRQTVPFESDEHTFTITNLIPGVTCHYKVRQGGRVLASDSLVPVGPVRMIAVEKGFNIRDLGGWQGLGGKTVRYGQIYRGGSLGGTDMDGSSSDIPESDRAELLRIGLRAHLDLRAETNGGLYAGEHSLHSYTAGHSTFADDFNNTRTDNGAYNRDASVISDIAWIIYELKRNNPVYFNCRQGADRTGTVAFVIEGLLGCDLQTGENGGNQMAIDYELTGFSQANSIDNVSVGSSRRPARDAYSNRGKLFRQLMELKAAEPDIELENLQQRCYYYLNRYNGFRNSDEIQHIDSADLDWFIQFMLGMSDSEYAPFRPAWALPGGDLKQIGESHANTVTYSDVKY